MNLWQYIVFITVGLQVNTIEELIEFCKEYPMERIVVWGYIDSLIGYIKVEGEIGNAKVCFLTIIYEMKDKTNAERDKAVYLTNRQILVLEKQIQRRLPTLTVSNKVI